MRELDRDSGAARPRTIWRWHEMMPVEDPDNIVTLGEGGTPLLRAERLGAPAGFTDLWIKDEGGNPTGSFKARGLSRGDLEGEGARRDEDRAPDRRQRRAAPRPPTPRRPGWNATSSCPPTRRRVFRIECERYGAKVTLVDGLIDACGKIVAERAPREGWHDVSTLKEPYRVEGKKTMGYELAEDFGWELPDAILYPTGGGTGLIGMWKAFDEMERLGWIGQQAPAHDLRPGRRLRADPEGLRRRKDVSEKWENAETYASGLRVPKAFADFLILRDIRASGGDAIAVTDDEMRRAADDIGSAEGLFVCPEGAAVWAAAKNLAASDRLDPRSRIVLFNTRRPGFKYRVNRCPIR